MKRVLACLLLLVSFATPAFTRDWSKDVKAILPSLAYIWVPSIDELGQSSIDMCTAFSINQAKGYYMTAAHCDTNEDFTPINGYNSSIIQFKDPDLDVMVLELPFHKPSLKANLKPIQVGKEVGQLGYALGIYPSTFLASNVAGASGVFKLDGVDKAIYTPDAVSGMSGGPIFNIKDEVIGVVQGGTGQIGFETPIQDIYKATSGYWEQSPSK